MTPHLVVTTTIEASPQEVFAYLVQPDLLVRWLGSWVDVDPQPGGSEQMPAGSSTVEIVLRADGDATIVELTRRDLPADRIADHRNGVDEPARSTGHPGRSWLTPWPLRKRLLVAVTGDVDHIAVRSTDEESANPPGLFGQRVNDLVTTPLRLCVGLVDVASDGHRNDRVLRAGGVSGHQLNVRRALWRLEVRDPSEVEAFHAKSEVVGVEIAGRIDIGDPEVCCDCRNSHVDSSSRRLRETMLARHDKSGRSGVSTVRVRGRLQALGQGPEHSTVI